MKIYGLDGKVAIITGSGRQNGLGQAIASRLASEGCDIVITDLGQPKGEHFPVDSVGSTEEMQDIAADLCKLGVQAIAHPCDVRDPDSVQRLVKTCVDRLGRLDIMVNNAGVGYLMKLITELEESEWDTVLDVNLKGVFLCTKYAAHQMIAQGEGGRIINIASQAAKSPFPYAAAYTSSKHGLVGLTRVSALELGKHNIAVNAVCPNHITTGLGAWQNEFFSEKLGLSLDEYMSAMTRRIPLGRTGKQADIAKTVAFLSSTQASYITGESINVSGGEEMH